MDSDKMQYERLTKKNPDGSYELIGVENWQFCIECVYNQARIDLIKQLMHTYDTIAENFPSYRFDEFWASAKENLLYQREIAELKIKNAGGEVL